MRNSSRPGSEGAAEAIEAFESAQEGGEPIGKPVAMLRAARRDSTGSGDGHARRNGMLPPLQRNQSQPTLKRPGISTASPVSGAIKKKQKEEVQHEKKVTKLMRQTPKFEGGAPEMRDIALLKTQDPTEIYCFGDNTAVLKFEIGSMNWMRIPVETDKITKDAFDGNLRYMSSCYVPPCPDAKILVTGGCQVVNGFPSSAVCEFNLNHLRKPKKKRNMLLKRYGHLSVYINGIVYVIGGFSHKDLPNEQPCTLSACERFTVTAEA